LFVHGLTRDAKQTGTTAKCFCLLQNDVPEARLLTYGYDANVTSLEELGQSILAQQAEEFAAQLQLFQNSTKTVYSPDRRTHY